MGALSPPGWTRLLSLFTLLLFSACGEEAGEPAITTRPLGACPPGSPKATQAAHLTAFDGAVEDYFGRDVAVSGDTVLVGAWMDDDRGPTSGSVYAFTRGGAGWTLQQKITAPDGSTGDAFGTDIDVAGDQAFISCVNDDDRAANAGSVYLFSRTGSKWAWTGKLTASGGSASDAFGHAVAVDGDTVLAGSPGDDDRAKSSGAAYLFLRNGTKWSQQQKLTAYDAVTIHKFGDSAALSGDTALVGAWGDDTRGVEAGAAYVFTRSGTKWSLQQKLTAPDGKTKDELGKAVALRGDDALLGAALHDSGAQYSGAAYLFHRSGTKWSLQQKLTAGPTSWLRVGARTDLGDGVATSGAIGDSARGKDAGAVYVWTRSGTTWSHYARLTASNGSAGDLMGWYADLDKDRVVSGAWGADPKGNLSGAAWIFDLGCKAQNGTPCAAGASCQSGLCVDGVCCDNACGGGAATDCQACAKAAGAATDGTCAPLGSGTSCRKAADACDMAETCDGKNPFCPPDSFLKAGAVCRQAKVECDQAETCSGKGKVCPPDISKGDGTPCKGGSGKCAAGICALKPDASRVHFYLSEIYSQDDFVSPGTLAPELIRACGPFIIQCSRQQVVQGGASDIATYMQEQQHLAYWWRDAAGHLLGNHDWDLFMLKWHGPDWTNHLTMYMIDPRHPMYEPDRAEEGWALWDRLMGWGDEIVARVMDATGPDALIALVSDHGGDTMLPGLDTGSRDPNHILRERGWLVDNPGRGIDWTRTRAFGVQHYVYLNVKGRDPNGIVEPGEPYLALREDVIEALLSAKDSSGRHCYRVVLPMETAGRLGVGGDRVGDVFMAPAARHPLGSVSREEFWRKHTVEETGTWDWPRLNAGSHSDDPYFVLAGPGVKQGFRREAPTLITSVAPTLSAAWGMPVPADADGSVLGDFLEHSR